MTPHSRYVKARGYPAVRKILDVMASNTSSPNMRRPATAAVVSRRYVNENVILRAFVYLCGSGTLVQRLVRMVREDIAYVSCPGICWEILRDHPKET